MCLPVSRVHFFVFHWPQPNQIRSSNTPKYVKTSAKVNVAVGHETLMGLSESLAKNVKLHVPYALSRKLSKTGLACDFEKPPTTRIFASSWTAKLNDQCRI